MKILLICVLLLLAPFPSRALAPPEQELQRFVQTVQTLSADFSQRQFDETGQLLAESRGRLLLARPGRFRWTYTAPYEQQVVSDGSRLWLYDPDLRQVTVRKVGEALSSTPAALLAQTADLDQAYRVEDQGLDPADQSRVLKLLPRLAADADFANIQLWLRAGIPQRLRFEDGLGGVTDIRFSNLRNGLPVDPAELRFVVPPGVDVVEADAQP